MNDRVAKVRQLLIKQKIDAILISSVPAIIYLTGYAGFSEIEREAFLIITKNNNYLITDGRYIEEVRNIAQFHLIQRSADNHLEKILQDVKEKDKLETIGIEEDNLTVKEYHTLAEVFASITNIDLYSLREIKDIQEISAIQSACAMGDKAFEFIQTQLKPGVTELDIAFKLETFIKEQHASVSFPTIVAFGTNSAIPHHNTDATKLKEKDIILLDFGVRFENYCSDMTRTLFIGAVTDEEKKVYEIVLESQKKAIEFLQSIHVKASDVDNAARQYIISQNYPSIPHALGHGIGIEVHEAPALSPKSKQDLTEGMVFSIEPGIYLPGKFGVRIEDLFAIQNSHVFPLTNAPKNLTIL